MVDNPSAPAFQLAAELKVARERAGLKPSQVAAALKCTDATVRRWERADGAPKYAELRLLLELYRIDDPDQQAMFEELRMQSDQPVWWSQYHPSDAMARMLGFEAVATSIRIFERSLVTGLLQTEGYAKAVMSVLDNGEPEPGKGLQLRLQRQARVLKSSSPPQLRVLLDEDTIRRPAAGPGVMRKQLQYLLDGPYPYELRVMPREVGVHPGSLGSFWIFEFPPRIRRPAVYVEGPIRSLFLDDRKEVERASVRYDQMWDLALNEEDTRDRIHAVMKEREDV